MSGAVYVNVFTNFEGGMTPEMAQRGVEWFRACERAHPEVRWSHLYNPYHLLVAGSEATEGIFSPFLLDVVERGVGEVGLHLHMHYEMVRAIGVEPIRRPSGADASEGCEGEDATGYGVLLTGYGEAEREKILEAAVGALERRGFPSPKVFCAGYSAADPALMAMLARKGFSTSMAAQPISRFAPRSDNYARCWHELLPWSGHVTPLTLPYRVNRDSILPPPHGSDAYLDLVEVPINLWVDKFELYLGHEKVTREEMFDIHFNRARDRGTDAAVAIGVHTEIVAKEEWGSGPVGGVIDGFLEHVKRRAGEGGVRVEYVRATEIAKRWGK